MRSAEIEATFVGAFVVSSKRDRTLEFLSNPKKRSKYLNRLNHSPDLDERFIMKVESSQTFPQNIFELLRKRGAPETCYVISDDRDLDAKLLPLMEAIEAVDLASWGTIVCCIPDRLCYYKSEAPGPHYLLVK